MSKFGATVKSFADLLDRAIDAAERKLRAAAGQRKPQPCPILIPVKSRRGRR